jgi:hypothetical protein
MRCSECNKIVRPVVALDIDGTMGDFHTHFLKFATGYLYGKPSLSPPVSQYDGSEPMSMWFCKFFDVTMDVWRDIKLAYRQGGMKRTMPSYGWGRQVTEAIHRAGAEIWITTTRPYLRLDNIDPDTRFWLERHRVAYDGLIYDEQKYSHLLAAVGGGRVVAVLEDLPEEFNEASRLFGRNVPILMRGDHNRYFWPALEPTQLVHDGEFAWRMIHSRILNWKGLAV